MPTTIFIAYAHQDTELKERLRKVLTPLLKSGELTLWDDRHIEPGQDWEHHISRNLREAAIILLLLSPDSLASDYFYGKEVEVALQRHDAGDAVVVPILLRPCLWKNTPIARLEVLPTKGKPVTDTSWDADQALYDVALRIEALLHKRQKQTPKAALLPKPYTPQIELPPSPEKTENSRANPVDLSAIFVSNTPIPVKTKSPLSPLTTLLRRKLILSVFIITGILLIGALWFWLPRAGEEPLKYDYKKLNTELTQKTKSVPLTGKFDNDAFMEALKFIDVHKGILDSLSKTPNISTAEKDSILYYKRKFDEVKDELMSKAKTTYLATEKELLKNIKFDTLRASNLLKAARILKVDTMKVYRYMLAGKWLKYADASILGKSVPYNQVIILKNLGNMFGSEYNFLTTEQIKEISYYQLVLKYMQDYRLKNVDAILKNIRSTHYPPEQAFITNFLTRRGLYNGS